MEWLLPTAAAGLGGYAISTLLPVRGLHDWLAPGAVRRAPAGLALTFDDGPHPDRTPAVLDLLARHGAHATFFVVGARAERHPALVRRIAAEGHLVASHTFAHRWLPACSGRALEEEIDRAQLTLGALLGAAPRLVRPPYGHRDLRFYRALARRGLTPVLWSKDTLDYAGLGEGAVLSRLQHAGEGDIVLLHDGNPRARGTLPALARFLAGRTPGAPALLPLPELPTCT